MWGKVIEKTIEFVWNLSVLNILRRTHDIPPVYSMISPQCIEHLPVYCTDIMQGAGWKSTTHEIWSDNYYNMVNRNPSDWLITVV